MARININKKRIIAIFKQVKNYYLKHFLTASMVLFSIVLIFFSYSWIASVHTLAKGYQIKLTDEDINNQLHLVSQQKIEEARIEKEKRDAAARLEAEIKAATARVEEYFSIYGSPMKGYGEIIVRKAYECGGNYKILVGIAGNESGLGKVPYKKFNPYGYLDGITYAGWYESLTKLSCVISQRFIAPCKDDLYCIIRKYGGPGDDKNLWVRNVTFFMSKV